MKTPPTQSCLGKNCRVSSGLGVDIDSRSPGGSANSAENIEILFDHLSSRIVNFTYSLEALKGDPLPWKSPGERTIASGPLRIYKTLPHNIAFLQCRSALKPLLSRTQCWNVDGNRTFCLQLRPGTYWRIEILGPENEQEVSSVAFKAVLGSIVAFEVTACPFIRAEDCAPLVERPDVMQPAKVWNRSLLRKITANKVAATAAVEGVEEVCPTGRQPIQVNGQTSIGHRDLNRPKFEHVFSVHAAEASRNPGFVLSTVMILSSTHIGQRPNEAPLKADGTIGQDLCSVKERLLVYNVSELRQPEHLQRSEEAALFGGERSSRAQHSPDLHDDWDLQDYGVDTPTLVGGTEDGSRSEEQSTTCVSEGNRAPIFEPGDWLDFTPPVSPCAILKPSVTPSVAAPPVVDESMAVGVLSRSGSCPTTPPSGIRHTRQRSRGYSLRERRQGKAKAFTSVDLSQAVAEPPLASPAISTPGLSSGWESEDNAAELQTPPRPSNFIVIDSKKSDSRTPSSIVISKTTGLAASTASYASSYLMGTMFSVAARIASRAVAGAAYTLTEQRSNGNWDDWDDDDFDALDDYGFADPASRAWGVED